MVSEENYKGERLQRVLDIGQVLMDIIMVVIPISITKIAIIPKALAALQRQHQWYSSWPIQPGRQWGYDYSYSH